MAHLRLLHWLVLAGAAFLAAACSDNDSARDDTGVVDDVSCEDDPRVEAYSDGVSETSLSGNVSATLLSAEPAPPARGINVWKLHVTDASGAAISDAPLSVSPFMPDHGHGSPSVPSVSAETDGDYEIDDLNLFMPGVWRVTISGALSTDPNDDVVFHFCVAG